MVPVTNQNTNIENAALTCVMVTERSNERAPKAKDLQKQKNRDQGQAQAEGALGEGASRDSSSLARPLLSLYDLSHCSWQGAETWRDSQELVIVTVLARAG